MLVKPRRALDILPRYIMVVCCHKDSKLYKDVRSICDINDILFLTGSEEQILRNDCYTQEKHMADLTNFIQDWILNKIYL